MKQRDTVVVTGMGAVTPYGVGSDLMWRQVRRGVSAIDWIEGFDTSPFRCRYGGEAKDFDPNEHLRRPCPIRRDKGARMGLVAAAEALRQARLIDSTDRLTIDAPVATILGSGMGPCIEAEASYANFFLQGAKAVRPSTIPNGMFNSVASFLSLYFGLRGAHHVIGAACASGSIAIGQAYLMVRSGQERIAVCGGVDSPLCPTMFSAWSSMRVLSQQVEPQQGSRPFDRSRSGFVISEGAAILVIETLESALDRGATILGEIGGYGSSSDAHHITKPHHDGQLLAIRRCLEDAGIGPDAIDAVNAHGTGTIANDAVEAHVVREIFGPRGESLPISANKSVLGHSLAASGALECLISLHTIGDDYLPPTMNCHEPDPDIGLDYTPERGREGDVKAVLTNSFAFGGINASLLLKETCHDQYQR